MIGIVLVSHSKKITDGLKELIEELLGEQQTVKVVSNGGLEDGALGTNPVSVLQTLESMNDYDVVYVFAGVGSSKMTVDTAIDLLEGSEHVVNLSEYSLVESAFAVSILAGAGASHDQIMEELKQLS